MGVLLTLILLGFLGLLLAGFALWVWAIVDIVQRQEWMFASGNRALWAIVVGLGGPLAAVIYLTVGRPRTARVP
jgi:hypothetical protein